MSKVAQLEAELGKLSRAELCQIREWLDDILEDERPFTEEFEAAILESEQEMADGARRRVRQP